MPDARLAGRRVLVVEDEYMMADDLAQALEGAGAQVIGPAPSVRQAMTLIDGRPDVQLAILDVNLGGEPVYPVADLLNERGVPFVFSTGYDAGNIPPRFEDVFRLEKPMDPADMVQAITRWMSAKPDTTRASST